MITIADKKNCTGCSACAQSCPKHCIIMQEDNEGFLYPVVDAVRCIDCHKCERICPLKRRSAEPLEYCQSKAYALVYENASVRRNSSSGGAFAMFAEKVIDGGGVVYGAAFSSDFKEVQHVRINDISDLEKLQGSKYVQSSMQDIYAQVRCDLENNRNVLFSGSPCQNAGLRTYLEKEYPNLMCVEFICHGVPSPKVWRKYLDSIKNRIGKQLMRVEFRSKRKLGGLLMRIEAEKQKVYQAPDHIDPFYIMFMRNISLRPACYNCQFKTENRSGDITIADFWGGEQILPGFGKEGDISLVLLHNEKARSFFEENQWNARYAEVNVSDALSKNIAYYHSVEKPVIRDAVFAELDGLAFSKLCKKYASPTTKQRIAYFWEKAGWLSFVRKMLILFRLD